MKIFAKKVPAIVLSGLLTAALFVSCSGKKDGSSASGESAGGTTGFTGIIGDTLKYDLSKPVNGGNPITLEFWVQNELQSLYDKLVAEYAKIHPNVKINITLMGYADLFQQKLPIALQTGTGPDIFHMHNSYDAALREYIEPFPHDVINLEELRADFTQVDPHIVDGKLAYIDLGLMTSGIFYNKRLWAEAGLTEADIPKSWDQFVTAAKKLTKTDNSGNIVQEGFALNALEHQLLIARVLQNGYFLFDETGNRPVVNTPVWRDNMQFIKDLFDVHKVCSRQHPSANDAFANEQSAMVYNWGWYGSWLVNTEVDWGFFILPTMDGKTPPAYDRNNGECTFCVSAGTNAAAKAVGFDLMKFFFCTEDLFLNANLLFNIAPTKKSLVNNPQILANKVIGVQGEIIERTIWPGPFPDPYITNIDTYLVQPVILNGASITDSMREAQAVEDKDFSTSFAGYRTVERNYAHAGEMK